MEPPKKQWWRSPWVRRTAVLVAAAALGASCAFLPAPVQPICEAAVKALHAVGVP